MKKVIALVALAALAGTAHAQLSPVPTSSLNDVGLPSGAGVNGDAAHWNNSSSLAAYFVSSNGTELDPSTNPAGPNPLGLKWKNQIGAEMASILTQINTLGGSVSIIFVGETAGWYNDFGYTYNGDPTDLSSSFSIWNDIQTVGGSTPAFGDHLNIQLGVGEAAAFDLWYNGANAFGPANGAGYPGGYYTALHPENSNPFSPVGNIRYTQYALMANTYVQTLGEDRLVSTYLLGFEDYAGGGDRDYNDLLIGLQFFHRDGTPFTPVPEPSTYGLIGAVALLGLVLRRRFAKK